MPRRAPLCLPGTPYMVHSIVRFQNWNGPCCNIVRASDSAVKTIGFRDNIIDMSAVRAFLGKGEGRVSQWYDQTGNSRHMTQATAASRPGMFLDNSYGDLVPLTFDAAISTGYTTRYMSAASLSLSANAVSVFQAVRMFTSFQANMLWEMLTSSSGHALDLFLYGGAGSTQTNLWVYNAVAGGIFNSTLTPRAQPSVLGVVSSSSDCTIYRDGTASSYGASLGAATITSMDLARNNIGSGPGYYDIFCNIVYASAVSSTDAATINTQLQNAFPIRPKLYSPVNVVMEGHSFMTGYATTFGDMLIRYIEQYLNRPVTLINMGLDSVRSSQLDTNFNSNIAPRVDSSKYNIYVNTSGINDIIDGVAGATAYGYVKSCCTKAKTAGFAKTIIASVMYTSSSGYNSAVDAFNTAARAGVGTDFDAFIDMIGTDSRINTNSALSNTTISPDGLHFTSLGQLYEAQNYAPVMASLFPY